MLHIYWYFWFIPVKIRLNYRLCCFLKEKKITQNFMSFLFKLSGYFFYFSFLYRPFREHYSQITFLFSYWIHKFPNIKSTALTTKSGHYVQSLCWDVYTTFLLSTAITFFQFTKDRYNSHSMQIFALCKYQENKWHIKKWSKSSYII